MQSSHYSNIVFFLQAQAMDVAYAYCITFNTSKLILNYCTCNLSPQKSSFSLDKQYAKTDKTQIATLHTIVIMAGYVQLTKAADKNFTKFRSPYFITW